MINKFPFHNVEKSPWPIFVSFILFGFLLNTVFFFHNLVSSSIIFIFLFLLIISLYFWWKDVINESNLGFHNYFIINNFYVGMLIMISSEIFFFLSFFWAFFHNCWFPGVDLGSIWPPAGLEFLVVDSFSVPFLNTIILLSSGISVTWAHYSLIAGNSNNLLISLVLTVLLGLLFLSLQIFEYSSCQFSFNSLVFGSCFYMLTGFHGAHVIVGTIFLFICLLRAILFHLNSNHHVGFELAIWYWHFVDVVWLFLFIFVYWYSNISI
uniref:Cytochrome c oxidase subunit 3 n=1 Tax=Bothromesostoma personatum TaxID=27905 RepID=A0A343VVJ1_9PLAT